MVSRIETDINIIDLRIKSCSFYFSVILFKKTKGSWNRMRVVLFLVFVLAGRYVDALIAGGSLTRSGVSFIRSRERTRTFAASYIDELSNFRNTDKKCLLGLGTDAWNIGTKKYKDFLAVHHMVKKVQKMNIAAVEIPMWEVAHGPHYDELQRLFESFWVPDMTSHDHFLLQFDLVIIPDPVIAKYMVESYYEKESKVSKKKSYYDKLIKQPWGVLDAFPPAERYEYERIRDLDKQKWIRKFPPIATCGVEAYDRMKNHGQIEYSAQGVEDFALHLPINLIPSRRVLLLRYTNRYNTLVQSLVLKGVNVTSAYPVTWMRKEWTSQEERIAKDVDVIYFHEEHAIKEWRERMSTREKEAVAACHDDNVARAAKAAGFKHVFYAKKCDTDGLTKTVQSAVEFAKSAEYGQRYGKK